MEIGSAALRGFGVEIVGKSFYCIFPVRIGEFCPSCHAKWREEWGEWVGEWLLLDVPHRPSRVYSVRVFFKYNRKLLSGLCFCGKQALRKYLQTD